MTEAIIAAPITPDGHIEPRFGRAPRVAVARVQDGEITDWTEYQVDWDALHNEEGEGAHHARIVRFMRDHQVAVVVAEHMGPGMLNTLTKLGLTLVMPAPDPDARTAVQLAAAELAG
jgi:predicted Fe-Mo cluster-binding NifX family protein